jgi:hypothetical protein
MVYWPSKTTKSESPSKMVVEVRYTERFMEKKLLELKYLRNKIVASVKTRFNDSSCWKAILRKYIWLVEVLF